MAPYGRVRCILSEPPNKQALRVAQDSDLRSGSDRSRPHSIRLETGTKMRSPMRHTRTPCTLWEECTPHKHGVRTHQHMSTGTYTAHHALHGVSRILNIPTVLPRISRLHLLDIRTVASPTTIQLTPPKHTSHTHEQTEGRQTACAVVPSLSDTLADCATVATPFLGGKICHVRRPPRCEHASV